jgi:hypothetical protein
LAGEIAVEEPVCHYGGCHESRPKSTGSGAVWEEISIEGKLIMAGTYSNRIEAIYSWKVCWDRGSNIISLAPFRGLATSYMLKLNT